tara:strand:+ start:1567 stop:1734 length:168 start_codon:yes stop_codon:yes gene_type:complete
MKRLSSVIEGVIHILALIGGAVVPLSRVKYPNLLMLIPKLLTTYILIKIFLYLFI